MGCFVTVPLFDEKLGQILEHGGARSEESLDLGQREVLWVTWLFVLPPGQVVGHGGFARSLHYLRVLVRTVTEVFDQRACLLVVSGGHTLDE